MYNIIIIVIMDMPKPVAGVCSMIRIIGFERGTNVFVVFAIVSNIL